MSDQDDSTRFQDPKDRAASKLHDPTPQRKKYVIDLLYRFLTDQISYAQLAGLPQKELFKLSEVGHVKLTHGRVQEAKKIFEVLTKVDHKNPFYHVCLGSVHQKMNLFIDAVHEYTEALKLKQDDLTSLVNRGEIYLKHKNFKRAAEDFRSAILLDPMGKNSYANRARSLVIAIKRNLQMQKAIPKPSARKPLPARPRGVLRLPARRSTPPRSA